ncbi:hypothetical protein HNV12_11380 [Methanococcoides sp. SA1]|nr:hypothetical protein [Methanococcoides sp. SA1]
MALPVLVVIGLIFILQRKR